MHLHVRRCGQGPSAACRRDWAAREGVPLGCHRESTLALTCGGKVLGVFQVITHIVKLDTQIHKLDRESYASLGMQANATQPAFGD